MDDNGENPGGNTYWFFRGDTSGNNSVIRQYESRELPMKAETDGLLAVSTEGGTLFRSFVPLLSADGPSTSQGVKVPSEGLYVDAYLWLSLGEELPDPAAVKATGDKLQFSLQVDPLNPEGDPYLVVTASRIRKDGELEPVNFVTTTKVKPSTWHRYTARLTPNASTKTDVALSAFVIYVDGQPVQCTSAEYADKIGAGAAEVFTGNLFYESQALFPNLQRTTSVTRLYAFGASGETLVDDVTLTNVNPYDEPADEIQVLVSCDDTALAALSYVHKPGDETEPTLTVPLTKPFCGTLITVKPGDTLTFLPEAVAHVALSPSLILSGNPGAVASSAGFKVVFDEESPFASSERLTVTISTSVQGLVVNGLAFETFREAVYYASSNGVSNVISLQEDVNLASAAAEDNGQARVYPGQDVVIDLQGKRLKGDHFNSEAAVYAQGTLEIIDTVGGGAIEAVGTAIEVVSTNDALDVNHEYARVMLGRETVTNLFTVNGRVRVSNADAELIVKVGDFLTPSDTASDTFYLTNYLSARSFATPHAVAGTGTYWRVTFDGRYRVDFDVANCPEPPPAAWVASGATLDLPAPETPGYVITNWVDLASGLWWTSGVSTVTCDITLTAQMKLADTYTISYDPGVPSAAAYPTSYTVESAYTQLGTPSRDLFTFVGWRDATSGRLVKAVGKGATFVGSPVTVYGDLALKAEWRAKPLLWANTSDGLAESNGTYRGSWALRLPTTIDLKPVAGAAIRIDEIAFGLVNPHLYPKTAPRLAVKTGGATILSAVRTNYLDATTGRYDVGTNVLANGRAKLGYRFDNLVLAAGEEAEIQFTDESGTLPFNGFLRLALGAGSVIGNCTIPGGDTDPQSEEYLKYCPLYEIRGEAVK